MTTRSLCLRIAVKASPLVECASLFEDEIPSGVLCTHLTSRVSQSARV